jgi:uncharacterized membrane protein YgcG
MQLSPCKVKTGVLSLLQLSATVLLCSVLLLSVAGCTKKDQTPPPLVRDGWITDYAEILSQADNSRISASLAAYEEETCHQILVLIVPSLAGESIEDFSKRTATAWDIGQPGFGNGILVSIALQEGSVRFEAGSAFETLIEKGAADRILKEVMFPHFRDERFVDGIEQGLAEIMQAARLRVIPEDHRPDVCRK